MMAVACHPVSKVSTPEDDIEHTKVDAVPAALVALTRHDSNIRELRKPMPPRPAPRLVSSPPPPVVMIATVATPSLPPPLPSRAPAPPLPRAERTEPITLLPEDFRELTAGLDLGADEDQPNIDAFAPRPLLKIKTSARTLGFFVAAVASAIAAWAKATLPVARARASEEWLLAKTKASLARHG